VRQESSVCSARLPSPGSTMTSKTGADHVTSEAKSLMDGKEAPSALTVVHEAHGRRDCAHTAAATPVLVLQMC